MFRTPRNLLMRYGFALIAFALPLFVSFLLRQWHLNFDPTWMLIIILVVVAWFAGRGPGMMFALLFALTLSYYAPPPYKLKYDLASFNRLALFLVLVLMTSARRTAERISKLQAQQQAALAQFGLRALTDSSLALETSLLDEAAALTTEQLEVEYAAVWKLPPEGQTLELQASVGWKENAFGQVPSASLNSSLTAYFLPSKGPLVISDLRKEGNGVAPLLHQHGVVSGVSVLISGANESFGVLSVHTAKHRIFAEDEVSFLQSLANILAERFERQRREKALQENREWLRVALASIGDAVIATDVQGRVNFMNPMASTLTGWTAGEAAGQSLSAVFRVINEDTRQEVENPVTKVLNEGKIVGLANHTLLIAKDGTELPIDDSGSPIKDDEGRIIGVILIFRGISERRLAEETVFREKLFTESLVNSLPGISYLIGEQGNFLRWNKNLESISGYSEKEISEMSPLDFFGSADRPIVAERIQDVFLRGEATLEAELITKRKKRIPHFFTGKLIELDDKPCLVGMGIDITQLRQAETDQAYLAAIVESSEDAIISKDLNGIITSWNAGAERLYGYPAPEAIGRPIQFLIPPDHDDEEPEILSRIRHGERIEHYETTRVRKDGALISVSLTVSPIRDKSGRIVGASKIVRNITEKKRVEKEREELLERERVARAEAQASEQRAAFLAQASEILSSTLDYEATLRSLARLAIPRFADWCIVDVVAEDGTIQRVTVEHQDPEKVALAVEVSRRYPPDPNELRGLANVLRTGQAELYPEITDALLTRGARDPNHLRLLKRVGMKSIMLVPLVTRGRTLGAITFVTGESDRRYSEQDLNFAQDLADRAALAVDNARLFYEAETALQEREQALELHRSVENRLGILVEASNTLLSSMQLEEVQQTILNISSRLIAADAYAVWRKKADQSDWHVVSAIGLSQQFQSAVLRETDFNPPVIEAPLVIETTKDIPWLEHRCEAYRQEGIKSLLIIPLKLHGEFAGTITFYYRRPMQFGELEVRVATALANLAAAAISSTELYLEQSQLRAQAVEANRLKDEFLATLSHELRSPLNSIAGNAEILFRAPETQHVPLVLKAAETIHRSTTAQAQLINDLLDLSRLQTGKLAMNKQPVSFSSIIRDAVVAVQADANAKAIQINLHLADETLIVEVDPVRLQQIVWNLVTNSVKFTPENGQILVSLSSNNDYAVLNVEDNGQGIEPQFLPFVFEMFRQADAKTTRRHGGMGIGLALVKQISELHGGSVEAASDGAGKGTRITVRFPLYKYAAVAEVSTGTAAKKQLQGRRLLVVDDKQDSVDMMRILLEIEGATVTAVLGGIEALHAAEKTKFDLLISDISMPEMDGYELLRHLRKRESFSDTPAIALTGYGREEDAHRAREVGFTTHLTKPLDFDVFMQVVIAALPHRN